MARARKGQYVELKEERMEKLYGVAEKTAQSAEPKRVLFGYKCPKCGGKLGKESVKGLLFAGEGCTEFAKKVAASAELPPGVYNLTIHHFTCSQRDYEYAKTAVSAVSD